MLGLLVRATSGEASLVFANPGDWGIDVLVGDLRGRVTVWQAKYFMRGVGRSQQRQIEGSFASALDAAARHGYTLEQWVLCIPASMDGPTTQWWHGWKAAQEHDTGALIDLWDETRLRELLLRPEAADVRRHYYNPYLHDGRSGASAMATAPDQRPIHRPPTPADTARAGLRHGTRIKRRTVISAVAGASAAGVLAAARSVLDTSATSGSGAPVPSRRPAWMIGTGYAVDCTPAVADGWVYVGNDSGAVYALHASTGNLRWIASTGHSEIFGSLAVFGRTLYVGSNSRRGLYALDTTHGGTQWHHPTGDGVRSGVTTADGIVYFSSMDNNVYAADAVTGKSRWRFATGDSVQSTPAIANGVLYVGSSDYYLYALDASSGRFRWKRLTGGYISSSPTVVGPTVYVGSGDHYLYALDAATGSINWARPTGGPIYFSSPAVANGSVYIGSTDGKVYALDAVSGRERRVCPLSGKKIQSSPVVSAGTVYIGSYDGKIYAIDAATGGILWAYATGSEIARGPAAAGGLVYVGSEDSNLYAFSTAPYHDYRSPATPMPSAASSTRQAP